jgi:hypothetical protein
MTDMPDSPAHARTGPDEWTRPQVAFATWQAFLHIGITAIAFVVIYQTVTKVARPYLGRLDWTPVAAGEIAFIGLYGNSVLLSWRKKAPGVTRGLLMAAIIAGSVILNIYGARGVLPDVVIHLVIVGAFFGLMLDGKSVIARLRGGKVRADRISAAEWAGHPVRSLRLTRWMQAWGEPSRKNALDRYTRLLYAVALAQSDERVGRVPWAWRRRLPVTLRFQLSTGLLPESAMAGQGDWQEALRVHVGEQLHLLGESTPESTAGSTSGNTGGSSSEDTSGSRGGNRPGNSGEHRHEDSPGSDEWPETKSINRAVLLRRVRAADERWQRGHDGELLPAAQVSAQLQVRMNRVTAGKLLAEARAANDGRSPSARREG